MTKSIQTNYARETPAQIAKHRDIARRYQRRGDDTAFLPRLRIAELQRIFVMHYCEKRLPDDDAGRADLRLMADHLAQIDPRLIRPWTAKWTPWIAAAELDALIARVGPGRRWKADALARELGLDDATRTRLKIRTIGAIDCSQAKRLSRRRRNRIAADRARRARAGARPHSDSAAARQPWIDEGISRSTWYRRRAAQRAGFETRETNSRSIDRRSSYPSDIPDPGQCHEVIGGQGQTRQHRSPASPAPPPASPACVRLRDFDFDKRERSRVAFIGKPTSSPRVRQPSDQEQFDPISGLVTGAQMAPTHWTHDAPGPDRGWRVHPSQPQKTPTPASGLQAGAGAITGRHHRRSSRDDYATRAPIRQPERACYPYPPRRVRSRNLCDKLIPHRTIKPTHWRFSTMTEAELIEAVKAIAESLRSDLTESITKLDAKCNAISDAFGKLKADAAGERSGENEDDMTRRGMAERVAADSVGAAEFSVLSREVADLRKKVTRPQADLNAFADVQARADAVMRTHNERAEPAMAGEDIVAYKIRQHRPMQRFSPKWKGVELGIIAADGKAFENVLAEIRADAMQAGLNPVGLPEFQHRKIVKQSPGGHTITEFIGNGTIFKQLSRPVRHVAFIGTRSSAHL